MSEQTPLVRAHLEEPEILTVLAVCCRRDSQHATATASSQWEPKTLQIAALGGSEVSFRVVCDLTFARSAATVVVSCRTRFSRRRGRTRLRPLGARGEQHAVRVEEADGAAVFP